MLRWNFDAEHVYVILGRSVEYRGSKSRLTFKVPQCSKGGHLEACQKFGILKGKSG